MSADENSQSAPAGECGATLRAGQGHDGAVHAYVRLCPKGHTRTGWACEACAGTGAILCQECPGHRPAVLIRAEVFTALPLDSILAELGQMLSNQTEGTDDPAHTTQ